LIGQIPFTAERRMLDPIENRRRQIRGSLPDGRVFESVAGHRLAPFEDRDSDFEFWISTVMNQVCWLQTKMAGRGSGICVGKFESADLKSEI
jgi:hypothetical protein